MMMTRGKPVHRWNWVTAAAVTVLFVSCETAGLRASVVAPVMKPVMDRHDDYVMGDTSLTESQQRTYLRSTEMLRQLLEEAQER